MVHLLDVAFRYPRAIEAANLAIWSRRHGVLVLWSVRPLSLEYTRLDLLATSRST